MTAVRKAPTYTWEVRFSWTTPEGTQTRSFQAQGRTVEDAMDNAPDDFQRESPIDRAKITSFTITVRRLP